jgi:hypothetical protein
MIPSALNRDWFFNFEHDSMSGSSRLIELHIVPGYQCVNVCFYVRLCLQLRSSECVRAYA